MWTPVAIFVLLVILHVDARGIKRKYLYAQPEFINFQNVKKPLHFYNFFPTMGSGTGGGGEGASGMFPPGTGGGGWPTMPSGGGGGGGGWPTMPGGGGDTGGSGGWPTMPGGGDTGGGGWPTMPSGGGDGGGGWPTMPGGGGDTGGSGGWPTMPGGGGGGWGPGIGSTTITPTTPATSCKSLGGSCVGSKDDCSEEVDTSVTCETGVCCLPDILPENCGKEDLANTRIVGGSETTHNRWPWQASLQTDSNFHFCGGSLIHEQWVVTAAHCVEGGVAHVLLGEHDRSIAHGPEIKRAVIKIISHENYKGNAPYPNDIALLKLNEPVTFTSEISPACLPSPGDSFASVDDCWISGWGDTRDTGDETKLNELQINVIDQVTCENKWGNNMIMNTHICVGDGDIGACNGDSGGPLSCKKDGKWMLAGATSFGITGCQTKGYPNVYTRVSEYRSWIINKIRTN